MCDPPHSCLCLSLASGFWQFLWLDLVISLCIQHFIKIFHIVEDLWLFLYFALALPRSVKLAFASPLARSWRYQFVCENLPEYSKGFKSYGYFCCNILASALPRSRRSGLWQFLCLDLVNINVYTQFYQHIPYSWRPTAISIFSHIVCFGVALIKEKWHLASIFISIPQIIKIFPTV